MVGDQKSEARVYLRRSETKQEMSLQDQLKTALGRAAEVGVTIQATLADVEHMQAHHLRRYKDLYLDDGLKGDDLERPAFQQMCQELQSSDTVGWLFCVRRDRLGRPQDIGSFEMALTEARFAQNGITLVFSDQIITPADMERELFSRVLISSVEYKGAGDFLVQHAERVITAQQRLAREGWWTGGKPLYGFARYEFPPNGGPPLKLERGVGTRSAGHHVKVLPDRDDPVRFIALKAMIAWWRQGLGFGAIATRLNKLGVPSPDAGNTRTENGVPHAVSGLWQVNTVKNILFNPRIAGLQDYGRRSEGRLRRTSRSGPRQLASAERKHKGRGKKRRAKLKLNAVEDRIQREAGFEPLIPHEEWLTLVERSRRRGATQEGRRRPKQVQRYAFGTRVFDQTDGCGHPLYGKMRDGKPEYMCGRYMKSRRTECNSNSVDGEQLTRFTLATLREQVSKVGGREAIRRRIEELARGEAERPDDPNELARTALEAKAAEIRQKLDQAPRIILEVKNSSLIKALEKRYAEDERELIATEAAIAKLPPPADRQVSDIDSEVEAALVLFDEIERLADVPTATEAIHTMLERIGLRIGLYFEEGRKGTRPVRKVVRGILALGDYPLPVPLYGEPRVLPAAALDPSLRDRLAAELEAADAGHPGAAAPTIDSGACCRDGHGHAQQVSEVAARRRDDVPVDAADPPAHGDGQESRPTGTVPEGIAPSRAQLRIAAAGLEPATPGL
jgi:DNA invertase Pin-like site-specific DNA recombinase